MILQQYPNFFFVITPIPARGEEAPDSDLDICVLTTDKNKQPFELMKKYRRQLMNIQTMSLDLLAFDKDDFYSYVDCPASFEHEIKNGVLLYEYQ